MGKSYTPRRAGQIARAAGLRYVKLMRSPVLSARRRVKGFAYLAPDGAVLRDRADASSASAPSPFRRRDEVGICPRADGHLQATGRDARRRKQLRYHDRLREGR